MFFDGARMLLRESGISAEFVKTLLRSVLQNHPWIMGTFP